jgi:tetratricopeptide (TPR) repeat protein
MRDIEIQLFSDGMKFAKDEFYLDAISNMNELLVKFPDSELVDDATYNIGLCYFNMNQFEKAILFFKKCIDEYPDGTISVLTGGNEYGNISSKCWYAIMNSYLALGKIDDAKISLDALSNFSDSYVEQTNGDKITFQKLATNSFNLYIKQLNK